MPPHRDKDDNIDKSWTVKKITSVVQSWGPLVGVLLTLLSVWGTSVKESTARELAFTQMQAKVAELVESQNRHESLTGHPSTVQDLVVIRGQIDILMKGFQSNVDRLNKVDLDSVNNNATHLMIQQGITSLSKSLDKLTSQMEGLQKQLHEHELRVRSQSSDK